MSVLTNILVFLVSIGVVWFFAGMLIQAVGRIARRFCKTGFITAFFILGTLTSISEFSVAIHSTATGVPGVSVGNTIGGSFVLLLFIVPVLAIAGKGITLNAAVSKRTLFFVLATVALPAILILDGSVSRIEGLAAVLAYVTVAYLLYRDREAINACDVREEAALYGTRALLQDMGRVIGGSVAIFIAGYLLVEQSVVFAGALGVAPAIVGLVLLSVGTNIPEIAIAIRSVLHGKADIAFGDYLGSATMNTLIFGLVALANGDFLIAAKNFIPTAVLMVIGFAALFLFVRKEHRLTARAAKALVLVYVAFLVPEIVKLF